MRIPRIYTPQTLSPNSKITLEPEASHHLLKVLRMDIGRPLMLFNGDGYQYTASISRIDKKAVVAIIQKHEHRPNTSPIQTELAIGLSKGDRFDWVLQKATELGVSAIVPLFTERSEVRLSKERIEKKMTSWQNIIISACEQCQRNVLPSLQAPQELESYLNACENDLKLVLHHRSKRALDTQTPPQSLSLLVGPEGGLSDGEIKYAEQQGFEPLKLGERVLRTETAPLAALSVVQFMWGDLAS